MPTKPGPSRANDTAASGFGVLILTWIPGRCPSPSTMMPGHEPTLIAAARSHMTASSQRGTFSQAELTAGMPLTDVSPAPNEPGNRCRIRTATRSCREEHAAFGAATVNGWKRPPVAEDVVDAWEWYAQALRAHA
jgi:hypothetical protein